MMSPLRARGRDRRPRALAAADHGLALPPRGTSAAATAGPRSSSPARTRGSVRARSPSPRSPSGGSRPATPPRTTSSARSRASSSRSSSPTGACSATGARRRASRLPGVYAKFATGETLWALALVAPALPGRGLGAAGAATRPLRRDATRRRRGLHPHVPGPLGGVRARRARAGGARAAPEIAYARELAGVFGLSSRVEAQTGEHGVRRLFRGEPASGAGLGTIGEGLAQLRRLSRADDRLATSPATSTAPALHRRADRRAPGDGRGAPLERRGAGSTRTATARWTTSSTRSRRCCAAATDELRAPAARLRRRREPVPRAARAAAAALRGRARRRASRSARARSSPCSAARSSTRST